MPGISLNRTQEIVDRATKRLVTAFISMITPPDPDHAFAPEGVIIRDRKILSPDFTASVTVWQQEDTCQPKIAKDPALMLEIMDALKRRAHAVHVEGGFTLDEQAALFESRDLTDKAAGIPPRLAMTFNDNSLATAQAIEGIPFNRLREYAALLQYKLGEIGGRLESIEAAHVPAMTAREYNEAAIARHIQGLRFTHGHRMLAQAHNLLGAIEEAREARERARKPVFH